MGTGTVGVYGVVKLTYCGLLAQINPSRCMSTEHEMWRTRFIDSVNCSDIYVSAVTDAVTV